MVRNVKVFGIFFLLMLVLLPPSFAEIKPAPSAIADKYKITLADPIVDGYFVFLNGVHNFGAASERSFDWGDGTVEYGRFPGTHLYKQPGKYTITRTIAENTDAGRVVKTAKVNVTIENTKPAPPAIADKYRLSLQKPVIDGRTVTVNGVHNFGSTSKPSFIWGDGTIEYSRFPGKHTYANPGTYKITGKISQNTLDGRIEKVSTITVTVK